MDEREKRDAEINRTLELANQILHKPAEPSDNFRLNEDENIDNIIGKQKIKCNYSR